MIAWQDDMSVGNAKIDNDHKYLLSIINTIEAALNCNESVQVLLTYVSELINHAQEHFDREEVYQKVIKFPNQEAHKREHAAMMEKITNIKENLQAQADSEAYQFTTPRLLNILRDWTLNHFKQEDMKMKEYFKAL